MTATPMSTRSRRARVVGAAAVLLAMGAGLAACSSSSTVGSPSSGEGSKSATQILTDAKNATAGANSVRISGTVTSGGKATTLDVVAGRHGGGGTIGVEGATLHVVVAGGTIYLKADAATWTKLTGSQTIGQLFGGRWLKTSASSADFSEFGKLVSPSGIVSQFKPKGTVHKGEQTTTARGQAAITLKDSAGNRGTLYVATTGKPYILQITGGSSADHGTITFDDYNTATVPPAPSGAIDLNKLEQQGTT
jgi:hypothetical protein